MEDTIRARCIWVDSATFQSWEKKKRVPGPTPSSYVPMSNEEVDAKSAHKTSQNLKLANDAISAADYDMASLPETTKQISSCCGERHITSGVHASVAASLIPCVVCDQEICEWCKQGCKCNWTPPIGYEIDVPDDVDDESTYMSTDEDEPPLQDDHVVHNNALRMRLRGGSGFASMMRMFQQRLNQELIFGSIEEVTTQTARPEPPGLQLRAAHGRRGNVGIFATRDFVPGEQVCWMEKLTWIYNDVFQTSIVSKRVPLPGSLTFDSFIRLKNFVAFDRKLMETPLVRWAWINHSIYPNLKAEIINPDHQVDDRVLRWIATEHIHAGDELTYHFNKWQAHPQVMSTWIDPPRVPNLPPPSARAERKRARDEA